jgi:hypothetical protein
LAAQNAIDLELLNGTSVSNVAELALAHAKESVQLAITTQNSADASARDLVNAQLLVVSATRVATTAQVEAVASLDAETAALAGAGAAARAEGAGSRSSEGVGVSAAQNRTKQANQSAAAAAARSKIVQEEARLAAEKSKADKASAADAARKSAAAKATADEAVLKSTAAAAKEEAKAKLQREKEQEKLKSAHENRSANTMWLIPGNRVSAESASAVLLEMLGDIIRSPESTDWLQHSAAGLIAIVIHGEGAFLTFWDGVTCSVGSILPTGVTPPPVRELVANVVASFEMSKMVAPRDLKESFDSSNSSRSSHLWKNAEMLVLRVANSLVAQENGGILSATTAAALPDGTAFSLVYASSARSVIGTSNNPVLLACLIAVLGAVAATELGVSRSCVEQELVCNLLGSGTTDSLFCENGQIVLPDIGSRVSSSPIVSLTMSDNMIQFLMARSLERPGVNGHQLLALAFPLSLHSAFLAVGGCDDDINSTAFSTADKAADKAAGLIFSHRTFHGTTSAPQAPVQAVAAPACTVTAIPGVDSCLHSMCNRRSQLLQSQRVVDQSLSLLGASALLVFVKVYDCAYGDENSSGTIDEAWSILHKVPAAKIDRAMRKGSIELMSELVLAKILGVLMPNPKNVTEAKLFNAISSSEQQAVVEKSRVFLQTMMDTAISLHPLVVVSKISVDASFTLTNAFSLVDKQWLYTRHLAVSGGTVSMDARPSENQLAAVNMFVLTMGLYFDSFMSVLYLGLAVELEPHYVITKRILDYRPRRAKARLVVRQFTTADLLNWARHHVHNLGRAWPLARDLILPTPVMPTLLAKSADYVSESPAESVSAEEATAYMDALQIVDCQIVDILNVGEDGTSVNFMIAGKTHGVSLLGLNPGSHADNSVMASILAKSLGDRYLILTARSIFSIQSSGEQRSDQQLALVMPIHTSDSRMAALAQKFTGSQLPIPLAYAPPWAVKQALQVEMVDNDLDAELDLSRQAPLAALVLARLKVVAKQLAVKNMAEASPSPPPPSTAGTVAPAVQVSSASSETEAMVTDLNHEDRGGLGEDDAELLVESEARAGDGGQPTAATASLG